MKRLLRRIASWTEGPIEKEDEVKKYFVDTFGDAGLESYKNVNTDNITFTEEGRLSLDSVKDLKGFAGENHQWKEYTDSDGNISRYFGKYNEKDWNVFLEDISTNGINEPIELVVTKDGDVRVLNGNHRLQAAIQLNLPDVPIIVKYRDNSEENYKIN